MKISDSILKKRRALYRRIVIVRLVISVHVGYLYIAFSSESMATKGGTFIEAVDHTINYLPYLTTNDNDKFYQSLLFQGCIYPVMSGANISYREELCSVATSDYQTFSVSVQNDKYRKDGTKVTLNDVYFTYNTLLKKNYWNIGSLDTYKNILVEVKGNTIEVVFPTSSIDNMIFFTNFILPAHLLANKNLETYVETFVKNPVGTSCADIVPSENDPSSIVFDLETCSQTLLRYYQIKQFTSQENIEVYVADNPQNIDLIITDHPISGYTENRVVLNRYLTFFFNNERQNLTTLLKKQLIGSLQNVLQDSGVNSVLVPDQYVFDVIQFPEQPLSVSSFSGYMLGSSNGSISSIPTLPELTDSLTWGSENNQSKEFLLPNELAEKFSIFMRFEDSFDKVSISFNDGIEYFPESFDASAQSTYYNLNPIYRNIAVGRNVYTIKGYADGIHQKTYRLVIHYQSEPTYPSQETVSEVPQYQPLTIVYFDNATNAVIIEALKKHFASLGIEQYFLFNAYSDPNAFEGKLTSKDYDIVLRSINMGLRKDLSTLFTSTTPTINPSLYVNEELASQINTYFLRNNEKKTEAKARIDQIYNTDAPLYILGKELGSINIKNDLEFSYPFRLYVLGWRKDFVDQIRVFAHVSVDRDAVFSKKNMISFLRQYW